MIHKIFYRATQFAKGVSLASVIGLAAFSQNQANAGYVVQYESSLGNASANSNFGNSIYLAYNAKINDNLGYSAEMLEEFTLKPATGSNLSFTHKYIRMNLKQKKVVSFGEWDLNFGYRYVFPTTSVSQNQGSLGNIQFRPELVGKMGQFGLLIMPIISLQLQRRKTAYVGTGGNPIFLTGLRLIPSFDITPTWFLASDFLVFTQFAYDDSGDELGSANSIDNEVEIGFKGETTNNWAVSVVAHTEGAISGDAAKAYSPGSWEFNLRFAKEF
jgi:hypothetical protein